MILIKLDSSLPTNSHILTSPWSYTVIIQYKYYETSVEHVVWEKLAIILHKNHSFVAIL